MEWFGGNRRTVAVPFPGIQLGFPQTPEPPATVLPFPLKVAGSNPAGATIF